MIRKHKYLLNYRLIFHSLGALLFVEAIAMLPPVITSFICGEAGSLYWLMSLLITVSVACLGYFGFRKNVGEWGKREGYLVVASVWVLFSVFSSIPFLTTGAVPSLTDAFFESMSGFSTTGASVVVDIDNLPKSILVWRAIMQWLGGMGIIVLSLSFGFGGMQLYIAEVSGPTKEKMSPRVMQTARTLWAYYLILTFLAIFLLHMGGMEPFDAICNGLCTVSTGGFCTKAASIGFWGDAPFLQYVMIFFMTFCSLNFTVTYFAVTGGFKKAVKNEEVRSFLMILAVIVLLVFLINLRSLTGLTVEETFRKSAFMIASAISGSGFTTDDIMSWTAPTWGFYLMVMMIGGCSGSATGGIKTVRISVLVKNSYEEFRRLLHPNAIIPLKFNNKPISADVINNVLAFVSLYICCAIVGSILMAVMGLNPAEAIGTTVSGLCNTGLGFGHLSGGNFYVLPDSVKWLYSILMLIGRLEIFTVLFVLTPVFWKR